MTGKELTEREITRVKIQRLAREGYTTSRISKKLKVSKTAVKKWKKTVRVEDKPRSGRPTVVTPNARETIQVAMQQKGSSIRKTARILNLSEEYQQMGKRISHTTVQKHTKKASRSGANLHSAMDFPSDSELLDDPISAFPLSPMYTEQPEPSLEYNEDQTGAQNAHKECFVCSNKLLNLRKGKDSQDDKIWSTFRSAFDIPETYGPSQPQKHVPLCGKCKDEAEKLLIIQKKIQSLKLELEKVQLFIASLMLKSFPSESAEGVDYGLKKSIFHKWNPILQQSFIDSRSKLQKNTRSCKKRTASRRVVEDLTLIPETDVLQEISSHPVELKTEVLFDEPNDLVEIISEIEGEAEGRARSQHDSDFEPEDSDSNCEMASACNIRKKMKTISRKTFSCQTCDKVYKYKRGLDSHTEGRQPFTPDYFKCEVPECGKYFCGSYSLERHKLSHDPLSVYYKKPKEKPQVLLCSSCGESYPYERSLVRHMKEMHGIKPDGTLL